MLPPLTTIVDVDDLERLLKHQASHLQQMPYETSQSFFRLGAAVVAARDNQAASTKYYKVVSGNSLAAIKFIREWTGLGLYDAKDVFTCGKPIAVVPGRYKEFEEKIKSHLYSELSFEEVS